MKPSGLISSMLHATGQPGWAEISAILVKLLKIYSFCGRSILLPEATSHRIHIGTGSNRQALIVHDWVDYSIGDHRSKKQTCKRTLIAGKKCGLSSKALLLGINYDVNQKVEVTHVVCVRPRGIFSIP